MTPMDINLHDILFNHITSYVVYSLIFILTITGIYFVDSKDIEDSSINLNLSVKSLIFILFLIFSFAISINFILYNLIYLKYFNNISSLLICSLIIFDKIINYVYNKDNFKPKYNILKYILISLRFIYISIIAFYSLYFIQEMIG